MFFKGKETNVSDKIEVGSRVVYRVGENEFHSEEAAQSHMIKEALSNLRNTGPVYDKRIKVHDLATNPEIRKKVVEILTMFDKE